MSRGYTLMEMLLSLALLAIVAGVSAPIYYSFQTRNDLDVATVAMVHSLRRAQLLSQGVAYDDTWGVHTEIGSIILFRGTSYATRNELFDEVTSIGTHITPTGVLDVVYSRFEGEPTTIGTLTFTTKSGENRIITISEKGTIDY